MSNTKKKKRRGNPFHAPKTVGEKIPFKSTPALYAIGGVSLLVQIALTVVGVVAYNKFFPLNIPGPFGFNAGYVGMALPLVMWCITIFVRIAFRSFPLDMWRMPVQVRAGVAKSGGWILKLVTLLVELELAIAFLVINVGFYQGFALNDTVMNAVTFALLGVLIVTIWLPMRYAGKLGRGEVEWKSTKEA